MPVFVSRRAALARARRLLRKQGEMVRVARSRRVRIECGQYYVINVSINGYVRGYSSLEELAGDLQVLSPWEQLEKEDAE